MRKAATLLAIGLFALTSFAYEYVTVGDGETITIGEGVANSGTSELSASAGATIVLPPPVSDGSVYIYTRLILTGSGTVTLVASDENFDSTVIGIANGVTAKDTVTLHVAPPSVTALKVGRTCGEKEANYPIADIQNVTFANPDGIFGLRESVTVKKSSRAKARASSAATTRICAFRRLSAARAKSSSARTPPRTSRLPTRAWITLPRQPPS